MAADNEIEYSYTVLDILIRLEILLALGIADSADTVRLTFEDDDGSPREVDFPVVTVQEYHTAAQWVAARDDLGSVPSVYLRRLFSNSLNATHLREDYWFQEIDSLNTVYLEYNESGYLEDADLYTVRSTPSRQFAGGGLPYSREQSSAGGEGAGGSGRHSGAVPHNRGVKRRDRISHLEAQGCRLLREGGKHTVYFNVVLEEFVCSLA